jgi:hypothetical protein
MSEQTVVPGNFRTPDSRPRAGVEPQRSAPAKGPSAAAVAGGEAGSGIEVHEEELGMVRAQQMYKLRCECGRSWFALKLPRLVQCPACHKRSLVQD